MRKRRAIDCALGPLIAGLQQRPPKGSEAQDVAQSAPAVGVFQTVAADEVGTGAPLVWEEDNRWLARFLLLYGLIAGSAKLNESDPHLRTACEV